MRCSWRTVSLVESDRGAAPRNAIHLVQRQLLSSPLTSGRDETTCGKPRLNVCPNATSPGFNSNDLTVFLEIVGRSFVLLWQWKVLALVQCRLAVAIERSAFTFCCEFQPYITPRLPMPLSRCRLMGRLFSGDIQPDIAECVKGKTSIDEAREISIYRFRALSRKNAISPCGINVPPSQNLTISLGTCNPLSSIRHPRYFMK